MSTNLGRIALLPQGDYSGATAYTFLDVVRYNGASYVCKQATTGNLPTNTTYWMLLNSDGAQGTNGASGTNGSVWHSGTTVTGGVDGDYFFKTDTSDIYTKVAGSWGSPIANIKGATGNTGATGASGQVFSYTGNWVGKPASLTNAYTDRIFITDVGVGGSEWYWDGSRYRAVGGSVILAARNASNSATVNTTTETKLISYLIPSGIIQGGDAIKLEAKVARTSSPTEAIAVNQFFQLHNTDSFQTLHTGSQQVASLPSGNGFTYQFYEYQCVNNTTIKQLTPPTTSGYGTGGSGANMYADRTVSNLSTTGIYAAIYAKYASTPTGAANCEFFRITLNTGG